ncbi:MAG: PD-(D/E)XK nuclease family protein [Candidatus Colwellbacteria bacterium]|nr:PD-(D/E)XK nuclease family protein [Candidatus Colwellbacteria bacterium]
MFYARRTKNLFNPSGSEPFRMSRSKIELFLNCPRCLYLDARLGIPRPSMVPLTLNNAVDALLKKEFDVYRAKNTAHPLIERYGVDAIPFAHADIDAWRDALRRGVTYLHPETNFFVTGGVDDVWVNQAGELIVVDYKATSKASEVTIDADWQMGYKRQMEIYQWLFRRNGFPVSSTGYFVYVNGKTDAEAFDAKLEFDVKLIPYAGDDAWVEGALLQIRKCLAAERIPAAADECEYCSYALLRSRAESEASRNASKLL